jgi:hypothetical protein
VFLDIPCLVFLGEERINFFPFLNVIFAIEK